MKTVSESGGSALTPLSSPDILLIISGKAEIRVARIASRRADLRR
jgi:hypothetical protein